MLQQCPAGAHWWQQYLAMWFQLLPAFEMSPGKIYDSLPATGHQCLCFLFEFYLAYYGLINSWWSWGHFEALLKTELSNGIRAPFKIHLFFISLMCVPTSGSMTCTVHQFFFPFMLPLPCVYLPISLSSLQVMDHPISICWYSYLISSSPGPPAAAAVSTDACSSSAVSVLYETFLSAASLQPWSQPTTPTSAYKFLIPASEWPLLSLPNEITFFAYLQSHKPQLSYCSHKVSSVIFC